MLEYYVRRFFRIAPAYYVVVGFLFIFFADHALLFSHVGLRQVFANLTFTQWLTPGTSSNLNVDGSLWTLTIEMMLYAVMPLLAFLISRRPVVASLVVGGLGVGFRLFDALGPGTLERWAFGTNSTVAPEIQHLFIARQFIGILPIFVLGMATRWAVLHGHFGRRAIAPLRRPSLLVLAALLVPSLILLREVQRASVYTHWIWFSAFDLLVCVLAVPAVLYGARPVRGELGGPMRVSVWLGERSYGLYLWHFPVILQYLRNGSYRSSTSAFVPSSSIGRNRRDLGCARRWKLSIRGASRSRTGSTTRAAAQATAATVDHRRVRGGRGSVKDTLTTLGNRLVSSLARPNDSDSAIPSAVPEPLSSDEFELVLVDAGRFWISRRDQVMRPYMARAGTWEPEEGRVLRSLVRPGCRFLDVGANVGYFSGLVHTVQRGVVVDAVEPDPTNVRALRFNVWANGINARVWPLALDDRETALHLSGNTENLGDLRSGRVGEDAAPASSGWVVPAIPGDQLFAGSVFDLVKLDVQGWELEILLGLDETLRRSPAVRIVVEFWPGALRERDRDPAEVLHRYVEMGYSLRAVIHGEPAELTLEEIVRVCDSGGPDGQVNLLLSR